MKEKKEVYKVKLLTEGKKNIIANLYVCACFNYKTNI